jgi:hypothetical protein
MVHDIRTFTYLTSCLFLFFYAAFQRQNESCIKFVRSLPFWKCWNFGRFLPVCTHKHVLMCRGSTFLHIHRGPPYTFAQITPLNPIFMGHRFNLCWHLLGHSNDFDQSNRVRETTLKDHTIKYVLDNIINVTPDNNSISALSNRFVLAW